MAQTQSARGLGLVELCQSLPVHQRDSGVRRVRIEQRRVAWEDKSSGSGYLEEKETFSSWKDAHERGAKWLQAASSEGWFAETENRAVE